MNKEPTYILQQDLPDGSKVGDEYEYVSSLDAYVNPINSYVNSWERRRVENNPVFFKVREEEKTTVVYIEERNNVYLFHIQIRTGSPTADSKTVSMPIERLAEILIAESKGELVICPPPVRVGMVVELTANDKGARKGTVFEVTSIDKDTIRLNYCYFIPVSDFMENVKSGQSRIISR